MFQHVLLFIWLIVSNWILIMSGAVSLIFEALHQSKKKVGQYWWWGVAAICIFIACFQAWLSERVKNEACLKPTIVQVQFANVLTGLRSGAIVIIHGIVANQCDTNSSANRYELKVIGQGFTETVPPLYWPYPIFAGQTNDGTAFELHTAQFLNETTAKSIIAGSQMPGWIVFWLRDRTSAELKPNGTKFVLRLQDRKGNLSETGYLPGPNEGPALLYVPGSELPFSTLEGKPIKPIP